MDSKTRWQPVFQSAFLLLAVAIACMLPACGDGDGCTKTKVICDDRENVASMQVMGTWHGTYEVGRYWTDEHDAELIWYGKAWRLILDRDGAMRPLFYRGGSFSGSGQYLPGQTWFNAKYSPDETWYFDGSYYQDGEQLVYAGQVVTHGKTIGKFHLERPRECLAFHKEEVNTCWGGDTIDRLFSSDPEDEENDTDSDFSFPEIIQFAVDPPQPATGETMTITASAKPSQSWYWQYGLQTTSTPAVQVYGGNQDGNNFSLSVTAPNTPGDYEFFLSIEHDKVREMDWYSIQIVP